MNEPTRPALLAASADEEAHPVLSVNSPEWDRLNGRRCALIRKELVGTLTEEEGAELERLQEVTGEAMDRDYPLPRPDPALVEHLRRSLGDEAVGGL